jgi:hypothetical protein
MPSLEYWKGILAKEYHGQLEKKAGHRNPGSPSNKKRNPFREIPQAILAGTKVPHFNSNVRVRIVTVRKVVPRDARAIWEKAILDSITYCGIWPDDNTNIIKEENLKVECFAGIPEMTRIEIEEI